MIYTLAQLLWGTTAAVLKEFGRLRVEPLPPQLAHVCDALHERQPPTKDGRVLLASASARRSFWLAHMAELTPFMAEAAGRLLSAHVTSCATERNWSLFGNIFTKTRNRLALGRAHKIAYVRANSTMGAKGADEEVQLSIADLEAEEEEGEEGEDMVE